MMLKPGTAILLLLPAPGTDGIAVDSLLALSNAYRAARVAGISVDVVWMSPSGDAGFAPQTSPWQAVLAAPELIAQGAVPDLLRPALVPFPNGATATDTVPPMLFLEAIPDRAEADMPTALGVYGDKRFIDEVQRSWSALTPFISPLTITDFVIPQGRLDRLLPGATGAQEIDQLFDQLARPLRHIRILLLNRDELARTPHLVLHALTTQRLLAVLSDAALPTWLRPFEECGALITAPSLEALEPKVRRTLFDAVATTRSQNAAERLLRAQARSIREVFAAPVAAPLSPAPHRAPETLAADSAGNERPTVTVGILTIGDASERLCRAALDAQLSRDFTLLEVRNVAPFHRAFQTLIDRCDTELFIQLDEDMILYPHAVGRMIEVMRAAPANVAMVLFHLDDQDRHRSIHGVKIFRTAPLKQLQARNLKSSEMDILEQLLQLGYRWVQHPETLGRHGTVYSPESIFHRYRTMYEKDILTWNSLTDDLRHKARAFAEHGTMTDLFAILGAAVGIFHAPNAKDEEKDYTKYHTDSLKSFKRILLDEPPPLPLYDNTRGAAPFRSTPLHPPEVSWRPSPQSAWFGPADVERSQQLTEPEAVLAHDISLVTALGEEGVLKLVEQNPSHPFPRLWLALLLWRRRLFSQALQVLEQLSLPSPHSWRVWWCRALVLRNGIRSLGAQHLPQLRRDVAQVLTEHPSFVAAQVLAGYASEDLGLGMLEEDLQSFQPAQTFDPPLRLPASLVRDPNALEQRLAKLPARALAVTLESDDPLALLVVGPTLRARGYGLWHPGPLGLIYLHPRAVVPPNFWQSMTVSPRRECGVVV